MYLIIFY
jgi:hypothetical protein